MMILYDSRMTDVYFLLKNFSFQEQLFHSQTQCLYIGISYPLHLYNVFELMINIL